MKVRTVDLPELLRVQIMNWESLIGTLPPAHPAKCHLIIALEELRAAEGSLEPVTIDATARDRSQVTIYAGPGWDDPAAEFNRTQRGNY